jgi:hypothetical protein
MLYGVINPFEIVAFTSEENLTWMAQGIFYDCHGDFDLDAKIGMTSKNDVDLEHL